MTTVSASLLCVLIAGDPIAGKAHPILASDPAAVYKFGGFVGERVEANVREWLLTAPAANPGMFEMFALRDRKPIPQLVPWAGEFVGKYLISLVQALRMDDDPALGRLAQDSVNRLLASQAPDGYLGPFLKNDRLLGNWDLWGHYHVMLALLLWHERTGQQAALDGCAKAADLIAKTYLGGKRRIFDAGSPEMNMAVVHSLGVLYRKTGKQEYLDLVRSIEKDWERAGDYFRSGLAGIEFFKSPRPRWESLHDLQGLVELYRITGDECYRKSFLHHWSSIRRFDRHNSGSFSSGEQATGNPFAPGAIETCCTIAWMALSIDALHWTGDVDVADELELSTFNGMLGAQHPSGRWWTYNTPMDGVREASAHSIVFQARAGTPELNCCSVNGPRGLGMLSEWAMIRSKSGLALMYLGPMQVLTTLPDGWPITIDVRTNYPLDGKIAVKMALKQPSTFEFAVRVPHWAAGATIAQTIRTPSGRRLGEPKEQSPGALWKKTQEWRNGDEIVLDLPMTFRSESGDRQQAGRMSIYRGPILLAFDQQDNSYDCDAIPALSPADLSRGIVRKRDRRGEGVPNVNEPNLLVEWKAGDGPPIRLRDYASAGSAGTEYRSWLPGKELPPPIPAPLEPVDGSSQPAGALMFSWRRPAPVLEKETTYRIWIAEGSKVDAPLLSMEQTGGRRLITPPDKTSMLVSGREYAWGVVAINAHGRTASLGPHKRFRIDGALPARKADFYAELPTGPDGVLVRAALAGDAAPAFGKLQLSTGVRSAAGVDGRPNSAVELDGVQGKITYILPKWPDEDYSVSVWVRLMKKPDHLAQIFSAWSRPSDDPLRLCIDLGKLFARIEAGQGASTSGVAIDVGQWRHVAAVKSDGELSLYLDGKLVGTSPVPAEIVTESVRISLGGNPLYPGDEHLAARFAHFAFYAKALSAAEVVRWAVSPPTKAP